MTTQDERVIRAALSRLVEPGDPRVLDAVSTHGAAAVYDSLVNERDLTGAQSDVAVRLSGLDPVRDLERADKLGIRFVIPGDDEWPRPLDDLVHAGVLQARGGVPVGLWVRGPLSAQATAAPTVSIVGSRSASVYGVETAAELGARLAAEGLSVVSGLAYGIDQAAHRGALAIQGGHTVAVLAGGADWAYPRDHDQLMRAIVDRGGAVVSEAIHGSANYQVRFLARNRVIAALGVGTVVVEAAIRSGANNTVSWAERLSRVVMAIPGPVTSPQSEGTHQAIRTGVATLVERAEHVLELVGAPGTHLIAEPRSPIRARDRVTMRERQVLDAVPVQHAAGTTSIATAAGIGVAEVRTCLRSLMSQGLVDYDGAGWRVTKLALD